MMGTHKVRCQRPNQWKFMDGSNHAAFSLSCAALVVASSLAPVNMTGALAAPMDSAVKGELCTEPSSYGYYRWAGENHPSQIHRTVIAQSPFKCICASLA
jgi:hypothetical protein